ncbi:eukaryotic translation initiation factor 3 subunit F-like [Dysidea avara]|uniref:eukaryotic translation initiation factor 3 subunit F-like n=1 Tax=Dysidea avara TaxID=196820 RepID=UPI00332CBE1F
MDAIDLTVHIHPVALFTIVGGYERRADTEARRDVPKTPQKRIIGTVLGSRERNILEVKTAFTVPHNETADEVQVDMEFAQGMFELHKKVKQSDVILGWFATGLEITEHSKLIHDYYNHISDGPAILVTVDTTLQNGRMEINSYIGVGDNIGQDEQDELDCIQGKNSHFSHIFNIEDVDALKRFFRKMKRILKTPQDSGNGQPPSYRQCFDVNRPFQK